jgi:hypothetical protein
MYFLRQSVIAYISNSASANLRELCILSKYQSRSVNMAGRGGLPFSREQRPFLGIPISAEIQHLDSSGHL